MGEEGHGAAEARARRGLEAITVGGSHELRTPLSAIIGYSEVALDEETTQAERDEDITKVAPAVRYLVSLINELGDVCKLYLGAMPVKLEEFELREVVASVIEELRGMAAGVGADPHAAYVRRAYAAGRDHRVL